MYKLQRVIWAFSDEYTTSVELTEMQQNEGTVFFKKQGSIIVGCKAWTPTGNSPNMEDNTQDLKDSRKGSQRLSKPNRTVLHWK